MEYYHYKLYAEMSEFNQIQQIKRNFFAMRNGIVADTIRRGGLQYKMIFGLNLPQIVEIAAGLPHTKELAEELWADSRTRESRLLAPMLYPHEELTPERGAEMLREAQTVEVADILCHRLLRHLPFALKIATDAAASAEEMVRYSAFRLMFNLIYSCPADIKPFAEAELAADCKLTRTLCLNMLQEIDYLSEGV